MHLLKNSIFTIMAVALTLASCNRPINYSHYESISTDGWLRSDQVEFDVAVTADGSYAQTLGLRTTSRYPFANLTLVVERQVFPALHHDIDTIAINLTDQEGNTLGQGFRHLQYNIPLSSMPLQDGDSVHVSIRHLMKRECLPGITDIGFSMKSE